MFAQETFQEYIEVKSHLPEGIALWMQPFLVTSHQIQDACQWTDIPREIFARLAGDFPGLLWFAVQDRHPLNASSFWLEIARSKSGAFDPIERLLCYSNATPEFLLWAFGAGYRRPVMRHPGCTPALFALLPTDASSGDPYRADQRQDDGLRELYLALNPNTPGSELEAMVKRSSHALWQALAENPTAETRVLSMLWERDEACHAMLARHPKTAPFLLREFFEDPRLHPMLAQNPALPDGLASLLGKLFRGDEAHAASLFSLALNPGLSPQVVEELSAPAISTKNLNVAFALMRQPTISPSVFFRLVALDRRLRCLRYMTRAVSDAVEYRWRCQQPLSRW